MLNPHYKRMIAHLSKSRHTKSRNPPFKNTRANLIKMIPNVRLSRTQIIAILLIKIAQEKSYNRQNMVSKMEQKRIR